MNSRTLRAIARVSIALPVPYLAVTVLLACSAGAVSADPPGGTTPLTLAAAEQLALTHEPGQAAMLAQAAALEEQSIVAGQLPDPMLRVGLANYPLEAGGFRTEGMTQAQLGIRQVFPPGKSRAVSTRQFQSLAQEMSDNAQARSRDVITSVRSAWLDAYYWTQAREIVAASRPLFVDLITVTESLYSVGRKNQQDVLHAELELSRLDDRLIDMDRQISGARAALSEWLGNEAMRPLADELPAWDVLPPVSEMHNTLASHPALAAADARIVAKRAGIDLARERFKPGWALDVGYGFRDGVLPNGQARSDFVSVSATFDLPVFRKNRQDRSLAAALSERRAADESRQQLLRRLTSQLGTGYARWQDIGRRLALYETQILAQASAQAEAALIAYQSDRGDFADVIRGTITNINARVDYLRLQVERAQSYAIIANLAGLTS